MGPPVVEGHGRALSSKEPSEARGGNVGEDGGLRTVFGSGLPSRGGGGEDGGGGNDGLRSCRRIPSGGRGDKMSGNMAASFGSVVT